MFTCHASDPLEGSVVVLGTGDIGQYSLSGGGLNANAGVAGVGKSTKYIFAIFPSMNVVVAVLGVAGTKPCHSLARL
jgi:hypothetical protein